MAYFFAKLNMAGVLSFGVGMRISWVCRVSNSFSVIFWIAFFWFSWTWVVDLRSPIPDGVVDRLEFLVLTTTHSFFK